MKMKMKWNALFYIHTESDVQLHLSNSYKLKWIERKSKSKTKKR